MFELPTPRATCAAALTVDVPGSPTPYVTGFCPRPWPCSEHDRVIVMPASPPPVVGCGGLGCTATASSS